MTRSLGEDSLGLYRLKESEQIMKATVNLNQILQGGLAGLVAWLFKTVNDLQGLEVKVPADIDGCCQFIYGDTYMTPLKKENIGHGTRRVNYNMFESLFTDE